jgi:nucleotide-binding universal stress UspA family protein
VTADDPHGPAIFCYDDSPSAQRAIRLAHHILRDRHPAVVLFAHTPTERSLGGVGRGPDAPIMGAADAEVVLERGVKLAQDVGFEAEGLRVEADRKTAEIILDLAEERDADVIVMGQRGRSGVKSALLGSVSRDVINAFHRPVLVV